MSMRVGLLRIEIGIGRIPGQHGEQVSHCGI